MKHFLERSQISACRLTRHHFVDKNLADLTTVCRNVCGIQSQVMAAAQMAFWARMHGLTRADIRSALWKSRTLEIQPFENFSRSIHRKIQEEAASLGDFLETSWEIKFSRRLFG